MLRDILGGLERSRQDEFLANSDFVPADGHWLLPLRSRSDKATLGILTQGGFTKHPSPSHPFTTANTTRPA